MIKGLVVSGYGINCEKETLYAFNSVRVQAKTLHLSELISNPSLIMDYNILAFPGGFSFADKMGSGNAFALKARVLYDHIIEFLSKDRLVIGICNGAQILSRLFTELGLIFEVNSSGYYQCEWHEMNVEQNDSPWLRGISKFRLPIAHGEGKVCISSNNKEKWKVGIQYAEDVNGSHNRIAAVTAYDGKMLITMPHPERAVSFSQMDTYFLEREKCRREGRTPPLTGPGYEIFKNAYNYFQ